MDKDYYKILGVNESDTSENIKLAYRKLARKWHPDVAGNTPDVLKRFKEINEAYEILSDGVKKAEYDKARRFYDYARSGSDQESSNRADNLKSKKTDNNHSSNPYFKNLNLNWEELFGARCKKERESEKIVPEKGEDVNTEVEISILEAIHGTEKVINMLQTETCPKCKGRKFINGSLCHYCSGRGVSSHYKKFTVKIPAGIKNNSKIRLSGEGGRGVNGGKNGDLYITVKIKETSEHKTEGLNIIKTVCISPYEAVLGADILIKTINGNYTVKIAPNTQNGQKIRLSGCGIVQNDKVGDMIIVLEIRIPKNLSDEEIALYKRLSEISSQNIRDSIYD